MSDEKDLFGPSYYELYKSLEDNNFMTLYTKDPKIKKTENDKPDDKINTMLEENAWAVTRYRTTTSSIETQQDLFSKSMKLILIFGQFLGLNPAMGILQSDYRKMKFKFLSWKMLYSLFLGSYQVVGTIFYLYGLCKHSINIFLLTHFVFNASTTINSVLFILMARKWPDVIKEITNSKLDEYVDPRVKLRCTVASIVILILAPIEYALAQIATYTHILDCTPHEMIDDGFKVLLEKNSWFFHNERVPYSLPLGIFIQVLHFIKTLNWNYPDIFITCVSLYLISIFDKINAKINSAQNKQLEPWFWRSVREDYTRATRLVRMFDDTISGITFVSLSNHLFFICLQTFNILQNSVSGGTKKQFPLDDCPNYPSGIFNGNEYSIYFGFSIFLLVLRFLAVSLPASRVHSAAVQPVTALHGIPTQFYCTEIQRFLEQIHSDDVALSGLQFFLITKSLILSVAGTIVTYELVLLQFNDDD